MHAQNRKNTRRVMVGSLPIGGGAPVSIQSMTNTDTKDIKQTILQIRMLERAGCELVRVSVPDLQSAKALYEIKKRIHIPIAADIHFDYRLAIAAAACGADKLRINPGNIGDIKRVEAVVNACKQKKIPIRIGVNSGSLEKSILEKHGGVTPEGLVESALKHVQILESLDFENIIISLKASSVPFAVEAYALAAELTDYPLHVGITEAGTPWAGGIKSAAGIGAILSRGIGDTIRVSLTGNPVQEIKYAKEILKVFSLRQFGIEFISCPTCARTKVDLVKIAEEVAKRCKNIDKPIKVAIMGCAVNGPGEAKEADLGIAAGTGSGLLFKKGEVVKKLPESELVDALVSAIEEFEV